MEMEGEMVEEYKPSTILYELVCCSEWKDEKEEHLSILPNPAAGILGLVNPVNYLKAKPMSVPESVKWLRSLGASWQVGLSPNKNILAILQNSCLETRCAKDSFNSILGKTPVLKDPNPDARQLAWNRDSSLLAVSFTNGQIIIYDNMAVQLFSIRRRSPLPSQEDKDPDTFDLSNSLAGLFFASERVKKNVYTNELISVDWRGIIKCFRQTNADQMTFHHEASVRQYYPKGVYAATYIESHGLVLVAGELEVSAGSKAEEACLKYGITIWRLVNDTPYYRIVFTVSHSEFRMDSGRRWKQAVSALFPNSTKNEDAVFKMVLSPNEKYVVTVQSSGTVAVWHLPSLKLYRCWPLKQQYHHWTENSRFNNRWRVAFNRWNMEQIDNWRFHPLNVDWWNDTVLIISRVNGCVSLCSVEDELPSRNLLGDSPEQFESPVSICPRQAKGFLSLECELRLKIEDRRQELDLNSGSTLSESSCLEMLDAYDSQFLPKTLIQEVLFWMTDAERFRPPRKRKRKTPVWKETHRLFLLRSITPLELFHQKIEGEEYGEALDLAKVYHLDADLVFQRQWSKAPVSLITIRDYLGKIKKRNWVLQECLERVPDNIDAARELLQFGLRGTDVSACVMISQGNDKGIFCLLTPDDLDISQEDYMLLIDSENLEVRRLLMFRKQFLYYLDILDTYELMVGGVRMVDDNFDGKVYAKLRSRSPSDSAIEMARASDIPGLKIMLTHHWSEIAPKYLSVISSFPETTSPYDYSDFLPEIGPNSEVLLWDQMVIKDTDWSDDFLHPIPTQNSPSSSSKLGSGGSGCASGSGVNISVEAVGAWYQERIREIEKLSGIISYAVDLTRLGVQRNIPELQELLSELEIMEILVYDAKVDLNLEELDKLSPMERLELLMSNANDNNFIHHLNEYAMPFLGMCEAQEPGSQFHLLDQYLTSISSNDLSLVLMVFENSKPGRKQPIVPGVRDLMNLAHNCIYSCKNPNQINNILAILDCLPERNRGTVSDSLKELHDQIDNLELCYQAVKVLEKYNIPMTLLDLKEIAETGTAQLEEVSKFFRRMCSFSKNRKPPMKVNEWKELLYDMLKVQKKVLKDFPVEECFELYVTALLESGTAEIINLARDFIDREPSPDAAKRPQDAGGIKALVRRVSSAYSTVFSLYLYLIPYEKCLDLILVAAQHYFDSASNYADPDIELCKMCLNLMQNQKERKIARIFDLIDAVKLVNKDFQLQILPQQVRIVRDKVGLLKQCMDNLAHGYRKTQQLLKLGVLLQVEDLSFPDIESLVFDMAGNAALLAFDMRFCVQICENIMAKGYLTGWRIFSQTAKFRSEPFLIDNEERVAFINYALSVCPGDEILNVLNSKYIIEIRNLQLRIAERSPDTSSFDETLAERKIEEGLNPFEKLNQLLEIYKDMKEELE